MIVLCILLLLFLIGVAIYSIRGEYLHQQHLKLLDRLNQEFEYYSKGFYATHESWYTSRCIAIVNHINEVNDAYYGGN